MNAEYEYQIPKDDPWIVQVRRITHKRYGNNNRGYSWRTYYEANSPADARRILSMLGHEEHADVAYRVVTP